MAGGAVRSTDVGKANMVLAYDGVMLQRWANHLTKATLPPPAGPGYGKHNWMLVTRETDPDKREAALVRAIESATRHFYQWVKGDVDEDHASAVFFNINLAETIRSVS